MIKSGMRRVTKLDYEDEFNKVWMERFTEEERQAMIDAIDAKLNQLIAAPDKQ